MSVSTASYVVWAVIGVMTLALWWWSAIRPDAVAAPGEVVGRLVANPVLRVLLVLGFMWLGWHLFAR